MQKLLENYGETDLVVDGLEAVEAFEIAWLDISRMIWFVWIL